MKLDIKKLNPMKWDKKILIIIPAIVALLLALIPTIRYQYPLSWDIVYHIAYAKVYAMNGFVFSDPSINGGQKIGYPPLFHYMLLLIADITNGDYFQIAKYLQPLMALGIVLSVSYVAKKFYGTLAGVTAGFMIISSNLFNRAILTIPENLALILMTLSLYFYYLSFKNQDYKPAILGGFLLLLVAFTHEAASFLLLVTATVITFILLIFRPKLNILVNYGAFLSIGIISLIFLGVSIFVFRPELITSILHSGFTQTTGLLVTLSPNENRPLNILAYPYYLGIILSIFSLVGLIWALKVRRMKDVYVILWFLVLVITSFAYIIGINVISYRLLIYIAIPLAILAGLGVSKTYNLIKNRQQDFRWNFSLIFIIVLFSLSTALGYITVTSPHIAIFGDETKYGTFTISPPTPAGQEVIDWFQQNGDKSKVLVSSNEFFAMYILAITGQPISYQESALVGESSIKSMKNANIGYLLYDKNLTFSGEGDKEANGQYANFSYDLGLLFFNQDPHNLIPSYAHIVYENDQYIICEVKYD